jgi:hypothetical protein
MGITPSTSISISGKRHDRPAAMNLRSSAR